MQLITGGLGFIGSHTARALLDLGQKCVLTQHHNKRIPNFLKNDIGTNIFIEPVDITDTDAFMELGERYDFSGIIHLGGAFTPGPNGLFEDMRTNMPGLANVLQASYEWKVRRACIASSLVVYNGATSLPWREDQPLSCSASFPIEAFKKAEEIFSSLFANMTDIECIDVRIAGIYGPLQAPRRGSIAGRLVHAAVRGTEANLENIVGSSRADYGIDWCYVKDCGRAIALLQAAKSLHHRTYNVASGRHTKNQEFVDAIKKVIPDFNIVLPSGSDPSGPEMICQDITRLHDDTGYEPQYDPQRAIGDYISWLRAGNAE